jgi:hypothetical protein
VNIGGSQILHRGEHRTEHLAGGVAATSERAGRVRTA